MFANIHTYIHTCMHTYINTYIHYIHIHTSMHARMHTYVHPCMHTYIHACVRTCIDAFHYIVDCSWLLLLPLRESPLVMLSAVCCFWRTLHDSTETPAARLVGTPETGSFFGSHPLNESRGSNAWLGSRWLREPSNGFNLLCRCFNLPGRHRPKTDGLKVRITQRQKWMDGRIE